MALPLYSAAVGKTGSHGRLLRARKSAVLRPTQPRTKGVESSGVAGDVSSRVGVGERSVVTELQKFSMRVIAWFRQLSTPHIKK
jgi:hypothetical protein